MKVAFVSGPYRAESHHAVVGNIRSAERVAKWLWAAGYAALCPHTNTAMFSGICPEENFLEGCLVFVHKSDLLVLAPGWERSSGAKAELALAYEVGIPVFEWMAGAYPEGPFLKARHKNDKETR